MHTDDETDDTGQPDYQIRSVRFKPDEWEAVKKHTSKHGVKVGSFLRNCALRAVGYRTDADKLMDAAQTITASVASVGASAKKSTKRR